MKHDHSAMTLDQQKAQFQKDYQAYSAVIAKAMSQVQALQPPSSAAAVQASQEAFYSQMKAAYDAAAEQVAAAKNSADWDAAQATLRTTVLTAYSQANDAAQAAPADVRQVLRSTCNG